MTEATPNGSKVVLDPQTTRVESSVPVQTRSERLRSTNPEDFPVVTGREAEWRLSPVEQLRALIDGPLDGGAYAIDTDLASGVSAEFVPRESSSRSAVSVPEDRLGANAWSQVTEVLEITLASAERGVSRVVRQNLGMTARAAHTVVRVQPNCHGVLVIESRGQALLAELVEIVLEPGSSLEMVSLQEWTEESIHHSAQFGRVEKDAELTHFVASMGGQIVVVNPSIELAEQGASGQLYGVYFAEQGQHIEDRVYVHHVGAETKSRVSYKGALQGAGARTVWVGDVLIGQDAVGTDSYEENRNLVLSDGTRADSIPNLEIKTGDIAGAGHASATGRFDDEHLFYLQSRGIPEVKARRLVVQGFLGEIIQKMTDPGTRDHLLKRVTDKLRETEDPQ